MKLFTERENSEMTKQNRTMLAVLAGVSGVAGLSDAGRAAIVINQVAGGGGSATATSTYTTDYVELYNTGTTAVPISGYLLQYASASATGTFNQNIFNFSTGSVIGAGDFLTINTGAPGTGGATNPTPNGTGAVSLAAASGSVRLLDATGNTVDLVGYGTLVTSTLTPAPVRSEGSAAPGESINLSDVRTNFADTNNNAADFTSIVPSEHAAGLTSTAVAAAVPEPATASLLAAAAAGILVRRRNRA